MIITQLKGGLGNQLFQYAAGRALALRLGVNLGIDRRIYEGPVQFGVGLGHFNIQSILDPHLPPLRRQARLRYLAWRVLRLKPRLFRESGLSYNEDFDRLDDNTYLQGYWQSERYFRKFESEIRSDLQIKTKPDATNSQLLDVIAKLPAVSLHIRRGDYVSDPEAQATHGSCSAGYYEKAIGIIAKRTGTDPVVFAFSDDPVWVRENLHLPFEIRVMDHNDSDRNYEDLRLMSACGHHIIANSSFSWWGAWLNPSPDKIVVAPMRWFAKSDMVNNDICPPDWLRIDSDNPA